ncbi:flagellar export chaperone FliS [Humidesulfovibrio sp.]
MLKAAKAYLATQVSTSSQGDLLLMLYDTAIRHLHQAIEKIRAGDVAGKGVLISKAINIVSELQECLNKDRGGEISKNLFQLYFYCNTRLLTGNMKMNTEMLEEVITILSGLRQAFAQIMPSADGVASLTQQGVTNAPAAQAAAPAVAPAAPRLSVVSPPVAAPRLSVVSPPVAAPAASAVAAAPVAAAKPAPAEQGGAPAVEAASPEQAAGPEQASTPTPPVAPVNPTRLRAANAYATSR